MENNIIKDGETLGAFLERLDDTAPDQPLSTVETLLPEVARRLNAIGHVAKHIIPGEIETLDRIIAECQNRKKSLENRRRRMLDYAGTFVELMPDKKMKGPTGTIYRHKSKSVEISVPDADLPEWAREVRIEYKADKKTIKAKLEEGVPVPGAKIVEKESWAVR